MARRRTRDISFERGSVRGIDDAVRRLRELGELVLTAAKQALKEGADMVVNDAKSRCPVRTGKLRDSIHAEGKEDGAAYEITADAKNQNNVAYGQFVEFSPNGHPFLYPAFDAQRDAVKNHVKQAIDNAVAQGS